MTTVLALVKTFTLWTHGYFINGGLLARAVAGGAIFAITAIIFRVRYFAAFAVTHLTFHFGCSLGGVSDLDCVFSGSLTLILGYFPAYLAHQAHHPESGK